MTTPSSNDAHLYDTTTPPPPSGFETRVRSILNHRYVRFVTQDAAHISVTSNLILCTLSSGHIVHGVVCATMAFFITRITEFFGKYLIPLLGDCWGQIASAALVCALTRVCLLDPLGITWKVNLLATALIAGGIHFLDQRVHGGGMNPLHIIIPFIPR